ncbi:T-lymphocyte surface antigen Ly-9-like [Carassius carassius]|uniref:T-lymphocyte surface antigen Ly-9-like n=1 Tax=Carassius carassius TaxID=217509 RepID=UPI0028691D34|nr:T-lymphocyte surface antigen Ly-9-like [Carassius carassius]XP_059383086.1 T-lymphocyte surface antigen Ly-9-like [Carassius carassius]
MCAFILYFICMGVSVGGEVTDITTVEVMEGGVLKLDPGLEDLKEDVQIMWTFENGRENTRVAQMHQGRIYTHYDMRFTGRVLLDQKTGILTIMNIRTNESGLYEALSIISTDITGQRYKVHVYAPVSEPAVWSSSSVSVPQSTGTSQETEETCSVFCSVKNDRGVFISWFKGSEMLNRTSNPDLSINLSLSLELHYNDPETYSCTAVNPVNNNSIHLHTKEICPRQEVYLDTCGFTEALVRLVLSGLLGITTAVFLIEHLFFCSTQKITAASVC